MTDTDDEVDDFSGAVEGPLVDCPDEPLRSNLGLFTTDGTCVIHHNGFRQSEAYEYGYTRANRNLVRAAFDPVSGLAASRRMLVEARKALAAMTTAAGQAIRERDAARKALAVMTEEAKGAIRARNEMWAERNEARARIAELEEKVKYLRSRVDELNPQVGF